MESKAADGTLPVPATSPPTGTVAAADPRLAPSAPRASAATDNIRLASAGQSDTGTATAAPQIPAEDVTVAHAPNNRVEDTANSRTEDTTRNRTQDTGTNRDEGTATHRTDSTATVPSQSQGTTTPGTIATSDGDDLAKVRAVEPQAADHIATYCSKTISSAKRDMFMAECRRREAEAWTRLVLQNEFPTLDEATRKKCSEPPFPDTYVAKESCARYELHAN